MFTLFDIPQRIEHEFVGIASLQTGWFQFVFVNRSGHCCRAYQFTDRSYFHFDSYCQIIFSRRHSLPPFLRVSCFHRDITIPGCQETDRWADGLIPLMVRWVDEWVDSRNAILKVKKATSCTLPVEWLSFT